MKKNHSCKLDAETCRNMKLAIQDTLDVVGGK